MCIPIRFFFVRINIILTMSRYFDRDRPEVSSIHCMGFSREERDRLTIYIYYIICVREHQQHAVVITSTYRYIMYIQIVAHNGNVLFWVIYLYFC